MLGCRGFKFGGEAVGGQQTKSEGSRGLLKLPTCAWPTQEVLIKGFTSVSNRSGFKRVIQRVPLQAGYSAKPQQAPFLGRVSCRVLCLGAEAFQALDPLLMCLDFLFAMISDLCFSHIVGIFYSGWRL